MSFSSSYLEKRKKRLKEREKQLDSKLNNDIAPVGGNKDSWFKGGALSDGYEFGDITKTILGTAGDAGINIVKGVGRMVEGLTDVATYGVAGVADLFGADSFAEDARDVAKFNATDEFTAPVTDYVDRFSLSGNKFDSVSEGLGQVATILLTGGAAGAAGLGTAGVTAVTTGVTGLSSMGSGMSQAYNEGATDKEAATYGLIAGVAEAGTELLFGGLGKAVGAVGLSKGISSLDDALAKKVSSKIANHTMKNFAEFGIKAGAEGTEEVISGILQAFGKKATYMSEEELGKLLKDEELLDSFIVGTITSGITQSGIVPKMKKGSLIEANKQGADFITGHTETEQKVIDKVVESNVAEREQELGRKLKAKERAEIEEDVETKLIKGGISIDTIEETLGGDSYKAYKEATEKQEALKKELDELRNMKKGEMTDIQTDRLTELKAMNLEDTSKVDELKAKASQDVFELIKADRKGQGSILAESYNERARRGVAFEVDTDKVDSKKADTYKRAMEAGVLNNTNATHDFVDLVATLEAEKGVKIDFSNNEKLKTSGFAVDGAEINGIKTDGGIILNANSRKNLNVVVGHEITHILEGTELYTTLRDTIISYAKSKGDYDARYKATSKLYEKVKDADIDGEITADLVGEYLFTDEKFIKSLTANKNLFQKVYDEIKYLVKAATAGSAEKKQLLKVQRAFEKAFETSKMGGEKSETKYSFSSIAHSFFGDNTVGIEDFENKAYKKSEGYESYVNQCLNNMRQTVEGFNEREALKEIEDSIDGIVRVAVAMKKAGYDILDSHEMRETRDSKNRLLFSSLEPNSDYFTSSDISTICDKRINFAEIYDEIVRREEALGVRKGKRFFDNVDNYFLIHKIMADKGLTQPCRECYVESMRKNLAPMANAFLKLMQETDPNNKANDQLFHPRGKNKGQSKTNNAKLRENLLEAIATEEYGITAKDLTVEMLTTAKGLAQLKIQAPLIYEAFNSFYGQSKPKMPKAATPFRFGELTALLTDDRGRINKGTIKRIMATGGFRLQSYSDFQIQNFADVLQVIFEAGTLGLSGHAYTKVPAFLDATKGTNLKRNISIFMYNDGGEWKLDRNDSFPYDLDKIYDIVDSDESGNTGIIAVVQNEDMAAFVMANNNIAYFIPFHKSGLKMGTVRETIVRENGREIKGYSGVKDHTRQQTEVWATTTADHKANTKVKKGINIYEFWDFGNVGNLSKNELIEKNVKKYIDACTEAGYLPKFREYVMNNSKVLNSVLKYSKQLGFVSQNATIDDISFEYKGYRIPYGYYKCLGDFGMFTPDGEASPIERLSLKDYDFAEAVKFFSNAETVRRDEILQQIANGEEREKYRKSKMTTAEIAEEIQSKRNKVVDEVISGKYKYSLSEMSASERDSAYMDAYFDGDDDLMQQLVDEAAKEAGYKYKAYHRTENAFTVFDLKKARASMDIQGFYFSADPYAEREYGSVRYDTYLKMENPYIVDSKEAQKAIPFDMSKENAGITAREWLQKQGYDGVIRKAEYFGAEADEYIVFDSSQIKSSEPMTFSDDEYGEGDVIPLSERFKSDNSDIRYSLSEMDEDLDRLLEELLTDEDWRDMSLFGGDVSVDDISIEDISEELNVEPKKIEILFRRKGLGESHIEAGHTAVMKQSRIDEAIEDSGAKFNPVYARKYITRISPKDFIDLTVLQNHVDRGQFDNEVKGDHGSTMSEFDYAKALQDSRRSPYLHIDRSTGRVISHNGRHRIRALEMAGIESVEIEVEFYDEDGYLIKYNADTIPDMAISSQFDTGIETHLSNIIPLNEAHRTEIEGTYGEKAHPDAGVKYSLSEIVAEDGTSYGIGVKLDSTLLDNLDPTDRISLIKEYVRELQGKVFTAFDEDGEPVDISIAEGNRRFRNSKGNRVATNKDLTTKYISKETKQEAIALIDELISTATYQGSEAARHPHDWLDNDGKNDWDMWTTYVQDKNNTIWEATLHIANTTNGEKILYDISLIKKAEQSGKSDTSLLTLGQSGESDTIPDDNSIAPLTENVKMDAKYSLSEDIAPVDNTVDNVDIDPVGIKYSDIVEQLEANQEKSDSLMAEYDKIANMLDNGEMSAADFERRVAEITQEYDDINRRSDALTNELTEIEKNNVTVTDAIKNYSKKDALAVVERMGASDLTKVARKKLADALWEGMNKNTTVEQRKAFAKEFAKTATDTIVEKSRRENPDYNSTKEQLLHIASGIGRLTFSKEDMAELRYKYDKDLKKFLGRWGYKGGTNADGTPKRRYPMSQFVVDFAREAVGTSHLEEMHDADAMVAINELYEELSAEVKNKWVNSYDEATEEDIESLKADIERNVLEAFETEGRDARVKQGLAAAYDKIDKQFKADKASLDKALKNGRKHPHGKTEKDRSAYIANLEERYAMRLAELTEQVKREKELAKKESERVRRKDLHNSIIEAIKTEYTTRGLDFDEVLDKAKRKGTFASVDNTPQRFIEKTLGYKEGQILNDLTVNKIALNESAGIKWLNGQVDNIRKLSEKYNIKPGSKESAAAQMYGEGFYVNKQGEYVKYGDAELAKDFPSIEVQNNIKALAKNSEVRRMYDETLDAINASRVRNGYPEIPKRADYFLHFRAMDDTFSRLGIPFNPNDIKAKDLPTDINGMTANLKPGQPYFASANRRMGIKTTYDLLGGIERYMNSAKNQIYHIDDIQTLRAVRNYVADKYGQANGLNDLDSMTPDEQEARIKDVYDGHLSTFAKFLNEEANIIAGKTSLMDRSVEGIFGRRAMQVLNTINTQVGRNMVGFNIGSAGTNFLPMVQATAKLRKRDMIKAFSQTISNKFNSDGFVENDPTLIRRKGADKFSKTPWEKASDIGYVLMSAVDNLTSEVIVRAKYNELTRNGLDSEQAHIKAGEWASRLMGDRSLGQMPQLFNSKTLGIFTKFQLEVRNQLDSMFYDSFHEAKEGAENIADAKERNAKTAAKVASTLAQLMVFQHIFGMVYEQIAGYNPTFDILSTLATLFGWDDEEESEDTLGDNLQQAFNELLDDLPYTSTFTGGRIPMSAALPIEELLTGEDEWGNEVSRLETIGEIAPYYILPTGYGQIKKTIGGLGMFSDEHPIAGSYTDSGNLRFPVEETPINIAQAAVFGQYANKNARDYFDNEYAPLTPDQVEEFMATGMSYSEYSKEKKAKKIKEAKAKELIYSIVGGEDLYEEYTDALSEIKAGVYVDRKTRVLGYLNSLDIDYATKLILYKKEFPNDNRFNVALVNNLNERDDISYSDMEAILTELGFQVDEDGNIKW